MTRHIEETYDQAGARRVIWQRLADLAADEEATEKFIAGFNSFNQRRLRLACKQVAQSIETKLARPRKP